MEDVARLSSVVVDGEVSFFVVNGDSDVDGECGSGFYGAN